MSAGARSCSAVIVRRFRRHQQRQLGGRPEGSGPELHQRAELGVCGIGQHDPRRPVQPELARPGLDPAWRGNDRITLGQRTYRRGRSPTGAPAREECEQQQPRSDDRRSRRERGEVQRARGESRTRTRLPSADFESAASAIPPLGPGVKLHTELRGMQAVARVVTRAMESDEKQFRERRVPATSRTVPRGDAGPGHPHLGCGRARAPVP